LHPYTVNRVIKGAADAAGLDPHIVQGLSGHSMRVGAARTWRKKNGECRRANGESAIRDHIRGQAQVGVTKPAFTRKS
jgi:hypothetical protein